MRRMKQAALALALAAPLACATAPRAAEAPYEKQLLRLAEILGSVHFLRNLCNEEGDAWRGRMEALLEAEDPDPERRARLIARFNHGYRTFEATYTTCTDSAVEAIGRYMAEGASLTSEIALRYGN